MADPTLYYLYVPGCPACEMAKPELKRFAAKHKGELQIIKVDLLSAQWPEDCPQPEATPTYLLHVPGRLIRGAAGAMTVKELEVWVAGGPPPAEEK